MKKSLFCVLILIGLIGAPSSAWAYDFQLYKNSENFGMVVFPKKSLFPQLESYFQSLVFVPVESGKAVMRSGTKGENETFMMPLEVQKKYDIKKFIVIQILSDQSLMVGIYDPEWGLTLPSKVFSMEEVKQNIPKTLNTFRGDNPRKETRKKRPQPFARRIGDGHRDDCRISRLEFSLREGVLNACIRISM